MKDFIELIFSGAVLLFLINAIHPLNFSVSDMTSKKKIPVKPYTLQVKGVGKISGGMKDNIGIAIFGVEETYTIANNRAQGKYVVVSFAVSNGTKNSITARSQDFTLVDRRGNKYNHDSRAQWDMGKEFLDINPGLTAGKHVAYDVPESVDVNSLTFKITMGLFGTNMELPLKVQFAQ